MICERVTDIIDAGPFVNHSREQLEAAHAHVRQCDRCAMALAQSESLTTRLEAMLSPGPSRDVTQNVMARIAALEAPDPQAATFQDRAVQVPAAQSSRWQPAAGAVAAAVATLLITASVSTSGASLTPSVAGFRMGLSGMPASGHELLAGAMGTMLYVFGLFVSDRLAPRPQALPRRHGDTEDLSGSS